MNIPNPALVALESIINRGLALDDKTRERLMRLDGQRFTLHCTKPELSVTLCIGEHILLLSHSDEKATAALTGSWDEFAKIALSDDPGAALINGDVKVEGDTSQILELRNVLAQLDIDWEAPLADLIGDVAAHQIGRTIRHGSRWLSQTLSSFRRQASEFVREESQWVPHPIQVEDFYRGVEEVALRTEKLEARINQIRQSLQTRPKP